MAEEKASALDTAKIFFNRFSFSQKLFLGLAVILVIVGIYLITNVVSSPGRGVLFSNLSAKDSGLILEQLKAKKVPYDISGNGSVISVPEDQIAELRIELAAGGLPEGGGVGFEIFDKSSISTTDFVQNINYLRALEGELSRTISQLREVISAKVHITLPKRSVFLDEQEEAKASIVLKLRPGAQMNTSIVPGILHLTAQSVEGLKPENIAVVDVNGALLSKPQSPDDIFDQMSNSQLAFQKTMESSLTRKIVNLLEPHVGIGKVRADVKLKLNFEKQETMQETVDPDKVAKVSEKTETSSSTGGTHGGGIPGVSSNVVQASGGTDATTTLTPSKTKSEKTLTNFEVTKTVTRTTKPIGDIQRLSVAVVIDNDADIEIRDDKPVKISKKRSPEDLDQIKRLVQAAVGYNSERGDVVEIANLPFDTSSEAESDYYMEKLAAKDSRDVWIQRGMLVAAILFGFFIFSRLYRKVKEIIETAKLPKAEEIEIPRVDSEKLVALQEAKDEAEIERELMEKYKVPKSSKKMGIIREKVKQFAQENIDGTASLVRSFLIED